MILEVDGWQFLVDVESTRIHTAQNATDHCDCGYCRNYYETVSFTYPQFIHFLQQFGVDYQGPSELMPFEYDLILACYRVQGKIIQWGHESIQTDGIHISPEEADAQSFFLWAGEMKLPWVQSEDPDDVISPANLPEFLERMQQVWYLRHGEEIFFS